MKKLILLAIICGGTLANLRAEEVQTGTLTGRVLDEKGKPVGGAFVHLCYQDKLPPNIYDVSVKTNDAGEYKIAGVKLNVPLFLQFLHPNSYYKAWKVARSRELGLPVKPEDEAFTPYYITVKRNLEIKKTARKLVVDAQLRPVDMSKLVAQGHIETKGKTPISGREVVFIGDDVWLTVFTDSEGKFQAHGLPIGTYDVVLPHGLPELIQKPIPPQTTRKVTIQKDCVTELDFEVDKTEGLPKTNE